MTKNPPCIHCLELDVETPSEPNDYDPMLCGKCADDAMCRAMDRLTYEVPGMLSAMDNFVENKK